MKKLFFQKSKKIARWTWPCFALMIALGWIGVLFLSGTLDLAAVDETPFRRILRNGLFGAPESLIYNLIIGIPFMLGGMINGFSLAVAFAVATQAIILAVILGFACYWFIRHGLPLWTGFMLAAFIAAIPIYSQAMLQVDKKFLVAALFLLFVLKLIDTTRNNAHDMRKRKAIAPLLGLVVLLSFLDVMFLVALLPTLLAMGLIPPRKKIVVLAQFLAVWALCFVAIYFALPFMGIQMSPKALFYAIIPSTINLELSFALFAIALAVAWFIYAKMLRYMTILIPVVILYVIAVTSYGFAQITWYRWVLDISLLLILPVLVCLPFMNEFKETKEQMRKRLLGRRKSIPIEERHRRASLICDIVTRMVINQNPKKGYIALYSAFGSELSLEMLKTVLGARGYSLAYPIRVSESDIEFFTTEGFSDFDLFAILEQQDPFTTQPRPHAGNLTYIDPRDIAIMIVPCVGVDKDNNRLGYGKGCYDRYIPKLSKRTAIWAVGFSEQLADSVPVDQHDVRVNKHILV